MKSGKRKAANVCGCCVIACDHQLTAPKAGPWACWWSRLMAPGFHVRFILGSYTLVEMASLLERSMFSALVNQYGLVALGVLIVLESAGLPLPGETMLLLAAAAAAQGVLPIGVVIAVAAVAAIIGDSLGYWIGHRYGLALLTRYGRWLRITPAHLDHAQTFFQRHGPKTVLLGRFVAIFRVLAAVLAGVSRMRYGVFLAYNALGGIVWATVIGFLGFQFGNQLPVVEYALRQAGWVIAGLAAVGLLGFLAWRWLIRHQGAVRRCLDQAIEWLEQRRITRGQAALRSRLTLWSYLGFHTSVGLVISILSLLALERAVASSHNPSCTTRLPQHHAGDHS
jgi:membrane protein DedA with SNARE-associated domain